METFTDLLPQASNRASFNTHTHVHFGIRHRRVISVLPQFVPLNVGGHDNCVIFTGMLISILAAPHCIAIRPRHLLFTACFLQIIGPYNGLWLVMRPPTDAER